MKKLKLFAHVCLSLAFVLGLFSTWFASPAAANADHGVIAYVVPNDATGDEIHLINPDGSNDHKIWSTGVPGLETGPDVAELTWKPDASELAFWSRFQEACSLYNGDIYAIRADGSALRRVTAPPACGANPGLPTGTVQVAVVNSYNSYGTFLVYLQGASKSQFVTLGSGEEKTVTFTDVMDFGPGVLQWAVVMDGEWRYTYVTAHADVVPGQTVQMASPLYMNNPEQHWGWNSPAYNSDGTQMGYFFGGNILYAAPSNHTTPGGVGSYLLKLPSGTYMPGSSKRLHWGSGARAHQLLYQGFDWTNGDTIYLVNEGDTTIGQPLVQIDPYQEGEVILGLDWLPDNSGFIFSASEANWETFTRYGNIFEYNFATKEVTRITNNTYGYPRELTISPDGSQIVYEYQDTVEWYDADPQIDLYRVNRDGSGTALLAENALSPAWSPAGSPVVTGSLIHLPLIVK